MEVKMTVSTLIDTAKAAFTISSPQHVINWTAVATGLAAFFNLIPWPQIAGFASTVWVVYSIWKEWPPKRDK